MLGSMATLSALLLYLVQTGASPTQVGIMLVARALPQALGPLAGALSDRVDARRLMIFCDLGQAAAVGAIALLLPPYWLLVRSSPPTPYSPRCSYPLARARFPGWSLANISPPPTR